MGEPIMGTIRTTGWAIAAASLMLTTGCAQGTGPAAGPATTAPAASSPGPATASAAAGGQGQTPGGLQAYTMPVGGTRTDVVARLPINAYAALPGEEVIFDASRSEGAIAKYEWDLDGDGTFDQTTTSPVLRHTYGKPFVGQLALRVSSALGSTDTLKTPIRIGAPDPSTIPLDTPRHVRAEAVSADGTEVKITWESDDPAADTWGVAVNGMPIGRTVKEARSITVTDVRREKDVLLEVFAVTADGRLGERAKTTLAAAK